METKINVAEILKDKPQGTKLYDWLHNIDVELDTISTTDTETVVWCTNETDNNTTCHRGYSEFGTERGYPDGLQILLPSKEMRDWSKFAWKKGDVLATEDGSTKVIFECFEDDTYLTFKGKYCLQETNIDETFIVDTKKNLTECFSLQAKNIAQIYIHNIEDITGGMLNMETLEIEKAQPEFKKGDIAFADYGHKQAVFIVSGKTDLSEGYNSFIALDLRGLALDMGCMTFFKEDLCKLRLATEEEKKQLFDALAKEGKAWDAEKKQIVDLNQKVELKPFDKVLVRDFSRDKWVISFFSFKKEDSYVCINHCSWNQCIPYEGNEHLLGTTKDVEG